MTYFSSLPRTGRRIAAVAATAVAVAGLGIGTAFAATSSGAARTAPAAAVPACTAGALGAWVALDQGQGAAGSIFYPLEFTNLSRHACAMRGFPGVSATDSNGRQLGSSASWDAVAPVRTVIVAPGATAHTVLRWSDAAVTTAPGCHPVFSTFELRIIPPGQRVATHAFFDLEACSHAGVRYLGVEPVMPGVGTING
jgi:hypothetical protein